MIQDHWICGIHEKRNQWEHQIVGSEGYTVENTSFAYDMDRKPTISYNDLTEKNLKYAIKTDSG